MASRKVKFCEILPQSVRYAGKHWARLSNGSRNQGTCSASLWKERVYSRQRKGPSM